MNYIRKTWDLFDNYLFARLSNRPSTALFWYLPESANVYDDKTFETYKQSKSPCYLMDYKQKLHYPLQNEEGIIVLPYQNNIGLQVNPEAAFQYGLGLHDQFSETKDPFYEDKFWHYANYFLRHQTEDGLWPYLFDWHGSKSPWYSALAQSRGAAFMLRAYLQSGDKHYLKASKLALNKFKTPTKAGGFLHRFKLADCHYYEEYPETPTAVLNGFMASLISIWEVNHFAREDWLTTLWEEGVNSLETMLPFYNNGWWSLYDLDANSPLLNVNSPRYHLLEIQYLKILKILSKSDTIKNEHERRSLQYQKKYLHMKALCLKATRKILYR